LEQLRACAWWPAGFPGTQTRHMPGEGRCPGGMPKVAAVLGLLRGAGSGCAGGADEIGLQAAAAIIAKAALTTVAERMTSPGKGADPEPIGRERAERSSGLVGRRDPLGWYLSCGPPCPPTNPHSITEIR
jgi:hypothetical protein